MRIVMCFLAVVLTLASGCSYKSPVPAGIPESEMDDYTKGLLDGERDANGSRRWVLVGCLSGVYGPFLTWALSNSHPPPQALLGMSEDYVKGYIEAYQKKSRVKNTNYTWIGFIVATAVVISLLYIAAGQSI